MPDRYDVGNLKSSFIIDYGNPGVQSLSNRLNSEFPAWIDFLRASYAHIKKNIQPAFSLDPFVAASATLESKKGSTNQRFALLEAMARSKGIPTRSHGVALKKSLWEKQLGAAGMLVPETLVLGWPQFWIDERWTGAEELFAPAARWVEQSPPPFRPEKQTLFDAIDNTLVDIAGQAGEGRYSLQAYVAPGGRYYDTRDELFAKMSPPAAKQVASRLADWLLAKNLYL